MKPNKIRTDAEARKVARQVIDQFQAEAYEGDPNRYETALAGLKLVAEYMRSCRPNGRFEWNGNKLSDGLITMREMADWTGWKVKRVTRLFKAKGAVVKHGRFWYTTKRLILDTFPEIMDRVGSQNW